MSHLDGALQRIGIYSKTMVLRRDLHLTGRQIHYRLIAAVVAKLEFVSLTAERQSEDLVTETYAEDRLFPDELANVLFSVGHRIGISRAVRKKYAIGF